MSNFLHVALAVVRMGLFAEFASAQQTLGSINGIVTDSRSALVQGAAVKAGAVATNLSVSAQTKTDGSFSIPDLPIGLYEVTFTKEGFDTAIYPQIIVQGNRTTTVNGNLKPGAVETSVTVNATPLMNQTDTTIGYVVNTQTIETTPLGTDSFTQLAILSPGVHADFLGGGDAKGSLGLIQHTIGSPRFLQLALHLAF